MSVGGGTRTSIVGLENMQRALRRLSSFDMSALLEQIGSTIETQMRERISTTKKAPDGTAWKPWSSEYAATRHAGHSLLVNEGDLRDSIQFSVQGDEVIVGSNLVYAGPQNAARPFVGLGDEDVDEIQDVIRDWMRDEMGMTF